MAGRGESSDPEAPDHYTVLGVEPTAPPAVIRQAYRRKALESHPDKNPGGEGAFRRVAEAYAVLGSEDSRQHYDSRTGFYLRGVTVPRPLPMNFDDIVHFNRAMAAKKGGSAKSFHAWCAEAEAEKENAWRDIERAQRRRASEFEAARAREALDREQKHEQLAKEALRDWQEEVRRWEERETNERAEGARQAKLAAEARLRELQERDAFTDELLEQTRQVRRAAKQQREREYLPTNAELDLKTDDDLVRLESALRDCLAHIEHVRAARGECIVCHENPRRGLVYPCGHESVSCDRGLLSGRG
jgi:curved DNA-binding protein CbpA